MLKQYTLEKISGWHPGFTGNLVCYYTLSDGKYLYEWVEYRKKISDFKCYRDENGCLQINVSQHTPTFADNIARKFIACEVQDKIIGIVITDCGIDYRNSKPRIDEAELIFNID